ncbi:TPA: hypothetical protein ACFKS5_06115 [Neisseria gonorrhoeae]
MPEIAYNCAIKPLYSGLNLNQDKATKPQTVQIVRQGEATPYWFLLIHYKSAVLQASHRSDNYYDDPLFRHYLPLQPPLPLRFVRKRYGF